MKLAALIENVFNYFCSNHLFSAALFFSMLGCSDCIFPLSVPASCFLCFSAVRIIRLLPGPVYCTCWTWRPFGFGKLWCSYSLEQGLEIWQTEAVEQGYACCYCRENIPQLVKPVSPWKNTALPVLSEEVIDQIFQGAGYVLALEGFSWGKMRSLIE